jgi:hypothetical protein
MHLCRCINHCLLIAAMPSALRQRRHGLDRLDRHLDHDQSAAPNLARACPIFWDSQSQSARGLHPGRGSAVQIAAICLAIGPEKTRHGGGGEAEIAFSAFNRCTPSLHDGKLKLCLCFVYDRRSLFLWPGMTQRGRWARFAS